MPLFSVLFVSGMPTVGSGNARVRLDALKRLRNREEGVMGIGASIFLIAVGAILTFALNVDVGGINLDTVGWILMAVGVIGLIATIAIWGNRRRTVVVREPDGYRRVEERTDYDPPDRL
jgi:Domain of unknown function (DUF6458)